MTESNAMSIRILDNIEKIIKNDYDLEEFAIIPVEDNSKNKSPVVYEEHHLGLESWCVKHVYQYACSVLFKQSVGKRKLPSIEMEKLNNCLIGALLINPNVTTFWNFKRELVKSDFLNIQNELKFCKLVLSHKPKSNDAFAYRRWLLKKIFDKMMVNNAELCLILLQTEFDIINMASQKAPNNYHSWNHRIWCMENIASFNFDTSQIVYNELSYSQDWINNHVSEHSGFHYRQYIINLVARYKCNSPLYNKFYNFVVKTLLNTTNDEDSSNLLTYLLGKSTKTNLLEEISPYVNFVCILLYDLYMIVDKLNKVFPEHEAIFYHRKFLVLNILKVPYEYHGIEFKTISQERGICMIDGTNITKTDSIISAKTDNRGPKVFKLTPSKAEVCKLYELISSSEKSFISDNGSTLQLSKYRKWLTHVVGFE